MKAVRRKLTNWESGERYSVPKSFMIDGPRPSLPKLNRTPFKPKGISHDQ